VKKRKSAIEIEGLFKRYYIAKYDNSILPWFEKNFSPCKMVKNISKVGQSPRLLDQKSS
jgi:hypothetical protein